MWKRDALALKLLQPGDLGKGGIRFFLSARVCLTFACNVAQWQIRWSLGFRYRWMWRVLARIEVNDDRNQNAGIDRRPLLCDSFGTLGVKVVEESFNSLQSAT